MAKRKSGIKKQLSNSHKTKKRLEIKRQMLAVRKNKKAKHLNRTSR